MFPILADFLAEGGMDGEGSVPDVLNNLEGR